MNESGREDFVQVFVAGTVTYHSCNYYSYEPQAKNLSQAYVAVSKCWSIPLHW